MTSRKMRSGGLFAVLVAVGLALSACGHTDEEMAAKQREIDKLGADLKAAKDQITADAEKYKAAQSDLEQLNDRLKSAGIAHREEADKLKQAIAEYKQRADQLAIIEQRFRDLKARLDKLNQIGLKVVVRGNRMVIQLPGDILFDSGKDELKTQGKEVLGQVAEVIRNDKELNNRFFVVGGHTDNAPYPTGGAFHDNWGLSLARARQVLIFLVAPAAPPKPPAKGASGGGLNPKRWAAGGYGETDPQAGTMEAQNKDEMQRNRRVELVVQPNVEEMLNLGTIK